MRSVSVLAHGGLGNQLFQYAAACSLADNPQVFSYAGAWGDGHPTLHDLKIEVTYPNRLHRTTIPGIAMRESWRDSVSAAVANAVGRIRHTHVITQRHPFDSRGLIPQHGALVLNGYFQHPSWWTRTWRSVASHIAELAPLLVREARQEALTVVKIRRSDYLALGWDLSRAWLERALEAVGIRDCPVIVLAEDEAARAFAIPVVQSFGCTVRNAPRFVENAHLSDFWVLASARTIVSANSSFSWWGAAVAEILGGATVAYPRPWLPNQWTREPLPDMGLPHWQPVDNPDFSIST